MSYEGVMFLTENREKEGVVDRGTTVGFADQDFAQRNRYHTFYPEPLCQCLVHYEGKLPDGHVFDSSFERGEPLRVAH